jgi:hypothetical protein
MSLVCLRNEHKSTQPLGPRLGACSDCIHFFAEAARADGAAKVLLLLHHSDDRGLGCALDLERHTIADSD